MNYFIETVLSEVAGLAIYPKKRRRDKRDLIHPSALTFRSFPDVDRNTHRAQVRPPDGSKGGRFRQPEPALCGEQSDRQTFQVLRLPWMATETAPGSPRHFLH
ncbi:hypothetical protein, partial [Candidatus Methylobacter oryzae]